MKLHQLIKSTTRSKKRVGRGLGSGKGKTGGRGTKGQKAKRKIPLGFVGGTLPLYKKLPFRRGFGNSKRSTKMIPVDIAKLNIFKTKSRVDLQTLIDQKLVTEKDARKYGVKLVGWEGLKVALTVQLPASKACAKAIERIGGKVVSD